MAENITLADLANLENETTAVNVINNNNAIITSAFTDVLSLSGNPPNQMGSPLDMNSWPILNLPPPGTANSPARLVDVTSTNPINISIALTGDVTAPAGAGSLTTTVGKVNGTTYPTASLTNTVPIVTSTFPSTAVTYGTIADAQITPAGITNASIAAGTIHGSNIRNSVALSVLGNTTNSSNSVGDIAGTTRQVLAVNTAGTGLTFAQPQGDQLKGTVTNDNASAGNVGEFISSGVNPNSVSLTTSTPTNVTSISLTAGDWDVWVNPAFLPAGTTTWTTWTAAATTTSASFASSPAFAQSVFASFTPGSNQVSPPSIMARISLSTTTTIFMVVAATFGTSTMTAGGSINARRRR